MKTNLYFITFVAALGGFLFGFDTAVISGAEQAIQRLWELDDVTHGLAVGMALWGTVLGAMVGGIPSDKYGRKQTLFWIGVLYLISALGSAMAPDVNSFMVFRFIGGLGVGASSVAAPMYISEISPPSKRGRLVAFFQFNLVLGILIAYFTNYLIAGSGGPNAWRWMLGIEAIPALAFVLLLFSVPRSPRWLVVKKGNREEALQVLQGLDPESAESELADIEASNIPNESKDASLFLSKRYRFPIILAFLFAFFNQLSGINAIIYFAPRIFQMTGMGESISLLSTAGIGLVNLVFTMLGLALIDRNGRRFLMYIGSIGYIVSLGAVAYAFFTETFGLNVPFWIFVFIASHAIGQGAVIWVFLSEIFPNEVRANGQSLGSSTHWVFAAIISSVFPFFAGKFGGGPIFLFFMVMMVFQLLFVWKMMPETKGKSLEELEKELLPN